MTSCHSPQVCVLVLWTLFAFSQAIKECPRIEAVRELLGALYSNRSFANEHLKDQQGALDDAQAVRRNAASPSSSDPDVGGYVQTPVKGGMSPEC